MIHAMHCCRYEKVTYNGSNQYLENPNRGFTVIYEGRASRFVPITVRT